MTGSGDARDVSGAGGERADPARRSSCWRCSSRCSPGSRCPSPARSPASSRCSRGGGRRLARRPRCRCRRRRTALLMPTYNEVAAPRHGGAAGDLGVAARRPAQRAASTSSSSATPPTPTSGSTRRRRSWRCAQRTGGHDRIFYRRRPRNTARKAGNIADWVTRFGAAYPQFLILDADSVMAATTLIAPGRARWSATPMSG